MRGLLLFPLAAEHLHFVLEPEGGPAAQLHVDSGGIGHYLLERRN